MPSHETHLEVLKQKLVRLQLELESTAKLDRETRILLEELGDDIDRTLEGDRDPAAINARLNHLEQLALRFEAEHPRLSQFVATVSDALSKVGI